MYKIDAEQDNLSCSVNEEELLHIFNSAIDSSLLHCPGLKKVTVLDKESGKFIVRKVIL